VRSLDLAPFDYADCAERVEAIVGDIRDEATVAGAMRDIDIVVHTAAALPLYSPEDIFSTDVDGTRILLEAAEAKDVERFVMISSTAVYGIPDHHPLLEDDQLVGVGPYGEAKIAAEEVCLRFRERACACRSSGPRASSGRSASACSRCSTTGPTPATASR
jgi:nucleoside-diphosphate-sugar epimerase